MVCACSAANGHAQSAVAASNATVSADALQVYSGMSVSSGAVTELKKGDAVIVDFEIKTTEKWCAVRRVGEAAKLGFVQCAGLARQEKHYAGTSGELRAGGDVDGANSAPSNGKKIDVKPPKLNRSANDYNAIERQVVHDQMIDINKLAEFEAAAKNGSPTAMARASVGHFAAGNFELQRASADEALEQYEAGLRFAGNDRGLQYLNLMSIAYIHFRRSEYSDALENLDRLHGIFPDDPQVAFYRGEAYYTLNRIPEAIAEWDRVMKISPSPYVEARLEKAQRDLKAESEMRERGTQHFELRYQGNSTPQLAAEILQTLEGHYQTLYRQLRFAPADKIAVVLYTEETFRDVTRAPGWAGALNDGRLRVPVRGLTGVDDELSRVLIHELTHSFINAKTRGRCPHWLNEGLAQYMEPQRSNDSAKPLVQMYESGHYIPLNRLEGGWGGFPAQIAGYAYAWSLAATETIVADSGMYGLERFFEHFSGEHSVEPAMRASLQTDYAGLERNTVDYLKRTYP
jgi:tetratricopeptide (TPR) repeat protein